jgi:hypothetical protein
VSAGKERIYASDRLGRTQALDAKTGTKLDVLPTELMSIKLTNWQTDRIYVGTDTGTLQCLRETELEQPIRYGDERKAKTAEAEEKAKEIAEEAKKADSGGGGGKPAAEKGEAAPKKDTPVKREPVVKKEPVVRDPIVRPNPVPKEVVAPKKPVKPPREKAPPKEKVTKPPRNPGRNPPAPGAPAPF